MIPIQVDMTVAESDQEFDMSVAVPVTPEYDGPYTVTPSSEQQTLETHGKKMTDDVTVEAAPPAVMRTQRSVIVGASGTPDENGLITLSGQSTYGFYPVEESGWADTSASATIHAEARGSIQLPLKTSADMTAGINNSKYTVKAPAGYYAEEAEKVVDFGAYKSPLTIEAAPAITVNPNTGKITAQNSGVKYLHPLQTSGYMLNSTPVTGVLSGSSEEQLPVLGAQSYTPSKVAQEIAAQQYLTGKQTIEPIPEQYHDMSGPLAFLGVDAELVTTLTLADIKLSATNFASWTPSTTATDILASRTAGTFTATDTPNWNYYIVWETIIPEVFYTGSPVDKAKPLFLVALHVNEIFRRPSTYDNIKAANLNNSVNMSAFTAANFLRYYGSTQGTMTYTWASSYGFYAAITAATLSSASVDSPTITAKSPKVTARCSTTYFSTGNAALVDQDKTIIKQKAYIYKAKIPTFMQGLWSRVISIVNEVDS